MRGVAEYGMLGRRQAIIVVLLCGFIPLLYFLSAAMVGLVSLRKSTSEGLVILLWSLLPAGLHWATGDITPAVLMPSVAILSQALKRNNSWQIVIMLCAVLGVFIQLSLRWQPVYVEQVELILREFVALQQDQGTEPPYTVEQFVELVLGFYGAVHTSFIILCLMLARWWQATLYNAGGFQQEFQKLRFSPKIMLFVFGIILLGLMDIRPFDLWLTIACIPPALGGIALMHWLAAQNKMGTVWLVLGYITVLLMTPIIILVGLLDSVLDLRKRIKT